MRLFSRVPFYSKVFAPAVVVYIVIFILSAQPGTDSQYPPLLVKIILRNGAHVGEYMVFFIALAWGMCRLRRIHAISYVDCMAWAAIITIIGAVADEFHQFFVPGRDTTASDLCFDALGMILGYAWIRMKGVGSRQHPGSVREARKN